MKDEFPKSGKHAVKESAAKILIVDDNEDVLQAARLFLKQHVRKVITERDPRKIPALLSGEDYDVIFLDMNFEKDMSSGAEGFHWLGKILEIDPSAVVILITAYGDVEMAVRAIKEGATDFILKPWQNEKLLATLSAAMNLRRTRREVDKLRSRQKQLSRDLDLPFHDFIGMSSCMKEIFVAIQKVAGTEANVLILGENGTGKELAARALHRRSARKDEVFISVDMGAISENLFESELFGHMKGAFTDAREDRAGRFETASGGTLFLDEIGNLSLPLQAKLLSVIAERRVFRVGSNMPRPIDVRLICATNMPLYDMVNENRFRQDLLYRINTVEIKMPPLRERPDDIPLIAEHFLAVYAHKYGRKVRGIGPAAMQKLVNYRWPGNVRELQHMMERAVIMSEAGILQPDDLMFSVPDSRRDYASPESFNLEEVEKTAIQKVLAKHGGNVTRAAEELGLTRTSLYRRLEKYGL